MPRMDGYEVLRRLRAGGSGIPVLFLTARDGLADRVRGLNGGADDYLVKPFELEEFLARIRAALRRTGGQPAPVLRSGSVELNTGSRTVFLKGKPVELTAREYALLEILLRQSGGFVTRDYLYEHLFDERDDSLSNMLDVYVYRLRQKFGSQRIVTRRGAGYQWVPE
jgi:two-component system OmpR family response regulator